jgi:hypothetical protein
MDREHEHDCNQRFLVESRWTSHGMPVMVRVSAIRAPIWFQSKGDNRLTTNQERKA